MSAQVKKSLVRGAALILLGIAVLFCNTKWMAILIPVALLVRYSSIARTFGGNRSL